MVGIDQCAVDRSSAGGEQTMCRGVYGSSLVRHSGQCDEKPVDWERSRLRHRLVLTIVSCLVLGTVPDATSVATENTVVTQRGACPDKMIKDLRDPMLSLVPSLKVFRGEKGDETSIVSIKLREKGLSGPYNVEQRDRKAANVDRYLVRLERDGQFYCGWVDADNVLVGRNPIKVSEIDVSDVFETRRGQLVKNPLF